MRREVQEDSMVWLRKLRHRMIQILLGSILALGAVGLGYTIWRVWLGPGDRVTLLPYSVAYLLFLVLFMVQRIPDDVRTFGILAILYGFAVFSFSSAWLASGGRVFLMSFILLASVLIGPRAGYAAIGLSLATYTAFGLAFANDWLILRPLASPTAKPPIITEGIGFALGIGMAGIALWLVQQGLSAANQANQDAMKARALLAERAQELDGANQLLLERSHSLEMVNRALEAQIWQTTGQTQLDDTLRGEQEIRNLADRAIQQLCHYVEAQVGALYVWDGQAFQLSGKFAYPAHARLRPCFNPGEGLVGQAAQERRIISISPAPAESLAISSGLGEALPHSVVISPFDYNGRVTGVVELGKFGSFTPAQMTFLTNAMEKVAIAINTTQERAHLHALQAETLE